MERALQGASDAAENLDESIDEAAQSTSELSGALEQTTEAVEELGDNADNAAGNMDNLSANTNNAADNMEQLARAADTTGEQVETAGEQARDASGDMEGLGRQARDTEEDLDRLGRQTRETEDEMDRFGRQSRETDEDTESLRERIRELESRLEQLETQSERTRRQISPLEQSARALRDGFRQSSENADKLKSSLHNVGEAAKKVFGLIGSAAKTTLSVSIKGITTAAGALSAIAGYSTGVGKDFSSSMSQVAATMGITKDSIIDGVNAYDLLKNAASQAGETTIFSASEAADALNYLALAGYDAQQAADALPVVLDLAAAGGLDLAYASDLATDAMAALGIEANSANLTNFGDQLAKTASTSNTSVAQLGEAILTVGGTAKSLAGGTTELNAALGVLANRGIKGSEGGTKLRNMILSLTAPTEDAADLMNELGLSVLDAEGNMRPINEIFKDLDTALSSLGQGQKTEALNTIFNKVDLAAVEGLLAGCGEEFDSLTAAIADSDGAMAQMADTMSDNLGGDIKSLQSKAEAFGIAVYEDLEEPLRQLAQKGGQYLTELKESFETGGFEGLAEKFGGVLAEVLSMGAEKLPDLLGLGSNMLSSVAEGILENADVLSESFLNILLTLPDFIMDNLGTVLEVGSVFISKLSQGISDNAQELSESAVQTVAMFVDFLKENIPLIVQAGKDMVIALADEIEKEVPALKPFTSIVKTLAENLGSVLKVVLPVVAGIKGFQIAKTAAGAILPLINAFKNARQHAGIFASILEVMGGKATVAIGIIGGLATAIGTVVAMHKEEKTAYEKAYDKEREYQQAVRDDIDALKELKDSSEDAALAADNQFDRVEDLWKELDKLADSSGRVKDADKERADYILGELNEALDTEYTRVGNQIQQYDELKSHIEDVIKQKRIEAMLDAYQPAYTEALQQQIEAKKNYEEKSAEINAAQATVDAYEGNYELLKNQLLSKMQAAGFTGETINAETFTASGGWLDFRDKVGKKQSEAFENEWDEIQKYLNAEEYQEALATVNTGNSSLRALAVKYENASELVGGYESVEQALQYGNFDEAEKSIDELLGRKKLASIDSKEFEEMQEEEKLQNLKDQWEVYQSDMDLARRTRNKELEDETNELIDQFLLDVYAAGYDAPDLFGAGVQDKIDAISSHVVGGFSSGLAGLMFGIQPKSEEIFSNRNVSTNTTDSHNTNIGQVNVYTNNLDADEFAETISSKQKLNYRGIGVR